MMMAENAKQNRTLRAASVTNLTSGSYLFSANVHVVLCLATSTTIF